MQDPSYNIADSAGEPRRAWVLRFCSVSVFTTKTSGVQHEIQDVYRRLCGLLQLSPRFPFLPFFCSFFPSRLRLRTVMPSSPRLGTEYSIGLDASIIARSIDDANYASCDRVKPWGAHVSWKLDYGRFLLAGPFRMLAIIETGPADNHNGWRITTLALLSRTEISPARPEPYVRILWRLGNSRAPSSATGP